LQLLRRWLWSRARRWWCCQQPARAPAPSPLVSCSHFCHYPRLDFGQKDILDGWPWVWLDLVKKNWKCTWRWLYVPQV
jgi:hypothetical protein